MIYLTGDTHGSFGRIADFCRRTDTSREDVLIILGDAGLNYYGGEIDRTKKAMLARLPITLLCIHGNHERRPVTIQSYTVQTWRGGMVYAEEEFPSLLFAMDGEVYDLEGRQAIAIGGAFSIDWMYRTPLRNWWPDEQPSPEIRDRVEQRLEQLGWQVDVVLSHTVPLKYEPVECFLPGVDQRRVDKSTERWLDGLEDRLSYGRWYCGHYHTCKTVDRVRLMFEDYDTLA